jgi:hypothetical protein
MAAGLPNAKQPVWAVILLTFGVASLLMAFLADEAALRWFLLGSVGFVVLIYSLPRSFWIIVGLAEK